MVIRKTTLIPLNDKRDAATNKNEKTSPSQLDRDVSLLLMNLFFHPFIFVMSLVFPVREMKGSPSSVKETKRIRLWLNTHTQHTNI